VSEESRYVSRFREAKSRLADALRDLEQLGFTVETVHMGRLGWTVEMDGRRSFVPLYEGRTRDN
jgi:hypothetical protein